MKPGVLFIASFNLMPFSVYFERFAVDCFGFDFDFDFHHAFLSILFGLFAKYGMGFNGQTR